MKSFNPSNFYISVIDLFAILLPGLLVTLVLYHLFQGEIDTFFASIHKDHRNFLLGFALLFSSYLFGHIISQISAYLDEWIYDNFRKALYSDAKVDRVMAIRSNFYDNDLDTIYVNTYQWSMYKLKMEYPEAASEVDRYMADSKFFRSLFVVLSAGLLVLIFQENQKMAWVALIAVLLFVAISVFYGYYETHLKKGGDKKERVSSNIRQWLTFLTLLLAFATLLIQTLVIPTYLGLACALLAAFAMLRYFKKRRKATETAYQYIIFLEDLNSRKTNV